MASPGRSSQFPCDVEHPQERRPLIRRQTRATVRIHPHLPLRPQLAARPASQARPGCSWLLNRETPPMHWAHRPYLRANSGTIASPTSVATNGVKRGHWTFCGRAGLQDGVSARSWPWDERFADDFMFGGRDRAVDRPHGLGLEIPQRALRARTRCELAR